MLSHIALILPADASEGARLQKEDFWEPEAGEDQEGPMKRGKQGCSRERGGKYDRKVFFWTIHSSHLCLPILAKRINMELSELDKRSNMLGFSVKVKSLRKPPFIFFPSTGVAVGLGR